MSACILLYSLFTFPAHFLPLNFFPFFLTHFWWPSLHSEKDFPNACAEKVNEEYRRMQADMFNLYPAIGEVNGRRSNYSMAIIKGEKREFGKCDVEIKNKKVEPKESIRGEIARTYLYMDSVYPGRGIISKKNRKLFDAWNQSDPVDEWECERAKRIEKIQGNRNEVVMRSCKIEWISFDNLNHSWFHILWEWCK